MCVCVCVFIRGLNFVCGVGDSALRSGVAVYIYLCNKSMGKKCFNNSDGYFVIGTCMPYRPVSNLLAKYLKNRPAETTDMMLEK